MLIVTYLQFIESLLFLGIFYFWELFCHAVLVIKRSPQEGIEASLDFHGGVAVSQMLRFQARHTTVSQ